jgi:cardiolipin synthase
VSRAESSRSAEPDPTSRLLTVPNVISLIRLALVPLFLWLLVGEERPVPAGILLGVIGSTDWVDGFLARRLGQVSKAGEFLDPMADRLAVAAALIGGLITGTLPAWFAWALLVREVAVGIGAVYLGLFARAKLDVRRIGKLATLLVYAGVAWLLIGYGGDIGWAELLGWATGVPGLILYYLVAFQYLGDAREVVRERSGRPG